MALNLKNLKSLFVVEEEGAQANEPAANPSTSTKQQDNDQSTEELVKESQGRDPGKVSAKLLEVLFAAMESQNLPGLDYLEYKQSLKSLEKMPMEEPVRYQSAFAMAQAMGATPRKLIESADHYLNVLKGEESKFQQALANQQKEQIGNRQETIQKLEAALKEKTAQIRKLTEEMEQHRLEAEKLKAEIAEATSKVNSTKDNFIATYNTVVSQIHRDIENMKKYLK